MAAKKPVFHLRWTKDREALFLEHLAASSNVAASERAAMMMPGTARRRARKDEAFDTAWRAALREGYSQLEHAMLERALNGTPVVRIGGDACGIVVAGLGEDGRGYVLADASVAGARPEGWARAVASAAAAWGADRVVAEANNGGAMVDSVLRAADAGLPVRLVHAARGKVARAEPVAALYEGGRVAHAGVFVRLEDEMAGFVVGGDYAGPGRSPDRADALVWALTALMLDGRGRPGLRVL